jgi:hypothetical protein
MFMNLATAEYFQFTESTGGVHTMVALFDEGAIATLPMKMPSPSSVGQ